MQVKKGWLKQTIYGGIMALSLSVAPGLGAQGTDEVRTTEKVMTETPTVNSEGVDIGRQVGIDQKLNEALPLETQFQDSTGKTVKLGDYFGKKPIILVTPFYKCRGSCALELDGMAKCFRDLEFQIGKEFNVVTMSIHPKETPEMAAAKKAEFVELYKKPGAEQGWNFLVGNWESIKTVTDAIGFRFVYDPVKDQIAHAAGIQIITPQGRISRYFYGVNYDPKQVRLALVEAGNGKIGTLADKVTLYCSSFDMVRGKYTPNIMRITQVLGIATVLGVACMIGILARFKTPPIPPKKNSVSPTTPEPTV
jgi:protein SCO1